MIISSGAWCRLRPVIMESVEALSKAPFMSRKAAIVEVLRGFCSSSVETSSDMAFSFPLLCRNPYCAGCKG